MPYVDREPANIPVVVVCVPFYCPGVEHSAPKCVVRYQIS